MAAEYRNMQKSDGVITRAFPNTPAVHRSISDGLALMEVTRLWKNMAADGTAVSERKTKLMTTPSQRSISSKGFFAVPIRTNPTTTDDDSMTIMVRTQSLAVVIALIESKDAHLLASFAAKRIFHESWVPWKMANVCNGAVTKNICCARSEPSLSGASLFSSGAHAAMCPYI